MFYFKAPQRVQTKVHWQLESKMRNKRRSDWADPNRLGQEVDSFLEAPPVAPDCNLYFVVIPVGRVFRLSPG